MNPKKVGKFFGLGAALVLLALAAGSEAEQREEATQLGNVSITLSWNKKSDVDLHVIEPSGERIFFKNPQSASGGRLDIDANADCEENITSSPRETISWPPGRAPEGQYIVQIDYFKECQQFGADGTGSIQWRLTVLVDGQEKQLTGSLAPGQRLVEVHRFTRGTIFEDPSGKPVGTPQNPASPGQTLIGSMGNLPPSSPVKVEVRRVADGAMLVEQQLLTDTSGTLADTVFLWDPGFDDQGRLVPEQLRGGLIATVRRLDGTVLTERRLETRDRPPERLFYPSNDRGELRPGLAVGDKVYFSGKNFPPNSNFDVYICRDRREWERIPGFDLKTRCTGTPLVVELRWEVPVDLDLIVEDPFGNEASIKSPQTPIDGWLSVDKWKGPASETFTLLEAPAGPYKIRVRYASGTGDAPFNVIVTLGDKTDTSRRGTLYRAGEETQLPEVQNPALPLVTPVLADSRGEIQPTLIWEKAIQGDWDIIADLDSDGTLSAGDLIREENLTGLVIARVVTTAAAALDGQAPEPLRMELAANKDGNHKNEFQPDENVYVKFNPSVRNPFEATVSNIPITVYIVTQGQAQPGGQLQDVVGQPETITVRNWCSNGALTLANSPGPRQLPLGYYTVVVDVNNNGIYDVGFDLIDDGLEPGGPDYGFRVGLPDPQQSINNAPPRIQTTVLIAGPLQRLTIPANKYIVLKAIADATLKGIDIGPGARLMIRSAVPGAKITITGGSDGIVANGSEKVEIYDVTITNNRPGWGISLNNVQQAVIDGRVKVQANGNGILVGTGSNVTIRSMTIFQNDGDGIRVESGATAEILRNIIFGNRGCGIRIGSGATVTPPRNQLPQQNTIEKNQGGDIC